MWIIGRKYKAAAALMVALIGVGLIVFQPRGVREPSLTFFAVGQGDSALFQAGDKNILIDGGPDQSVRWRLGRVLPFNERVIDLVVVSHFHDDHVSGLISLIEYYQVKELAYRIPAAGELAEELLAAARHRSVRLRPIEEETTVEVSHGCLLSLLPPPQGIPADDNNSLAALFRCPGLSALLTGDSSASVESSLIRSGIDLNVSVLKAAHHGSRTANSEEFLRATSPDFLVISSGAGNSYGHPHSEVLARAAALGIAVFRTDSGQNIVFRGSSSP